MTKHTHWFRFLAVAWVVLSALAVWAAEEPIRTPSEQMKEAVEKLGNTPAAIRKSLEHLTDRMQKPSGKANDRNKSEPADLNLPRATPQRPDTPHQPHMLLALVQLFSNHHLVT